MTEAVSFYRWHIGLCGKKPKFTMKKITEIFNYENTENKADKMEQLYDGNGRAVPLYYCRNTGAVVSRQEILAKYDRMAADLNLEDGRYVKFNIMKNNESTPPEIIQHVLATTKKPIKYTYGLKFRHPTTYMRPVSNSDALNCFNGEMCDVTEYEDCIDLNEYSGNDMW